MNPSIAVAAPVPAAEKVEPPSGSDNRRRSSAAADSDFSPALSRAREALDRSSSDSVRQRPEGDRRTAEDESPESGAVRPDAAAERREPDDSTSAGSAPPDTNDSAPAGPTSPDEGSAPQQISSSVLVGNGVAMADEEMIDLSGPLVVDELAETAGTGAEPTSAEVTAPAETIVAATETDAAADASTDEVPTDDSSDASVDVRTPVVVSPPDGAAPTAPLAAEVAAPQGAAPPGEIEPSATTSARPTQPTIEMVAEVAAETPRPVDAEVTADAVASDPEPPTGADPAAAPDEFVPAETAPAKPDSKRLSAGSGPVVDNGTAMVGEVEIPTVGPSAVAATSPSAAPEGVAVLAREVPTQTAVTAPTAAPMAQDGPVDAENADLWTDVQRAFNRIRSGADGQELRIRLRPAELGELLVQVRTQGEQVAVRLVASTPAAQQALLDDRQRLASELAAAGFDEGFVDISHENESQSGDREDETETGVAESYPIGTGHRPVRNPNLDRVRLGRRGNNSINLTL